MKLSVNQFLQPASNRRESIHWIQPLNNTTPAKDSGKPLHQSDWYYFVDKGSGMSMWLSAEDMKMVAKVNTEEELKSESEVNKRLKLKSSANILLYL